jgi:hypothetical protein
LQLDNRLRLFFGELELRDQAFARFLGSLGGTDDLDNFIQVIQRFLEAEQNMLALARLAQQVIGSAADDVDAMLNESLDRVDQPSSRGWPLTIASRITPKLI